MPDSVPIPLDVLAETRAALDAALLCVGSAHPACTQIEKARRKLGECLSNKPINGAVNCDNIKLKRKALHAIALLHDVANGLEG